MAMCYPERCLTDWAFSCRRALAAKAETPKTPAYYQTIKLATRKPAGCNALLGGGRIRRDAESGGQEL